eukprot:TRINITY_DN121496_c0_g1_i1.p1 TRINITY_DN121496_c0_g1~~TRINITY_DN121496_c0_g1_i1.p1  ORF type:complete len:512 (-),score=121.62 TRINITY_DN121496_c0_g1_i1:57-1592(-)
MGHYGLEEARVVVVDAKVATKDVAMAKVKATGRLGKVIAHDPTDETLTYKLEFSDGAAPDVDWLAGRDVELLSDAISTAATLPSAAGAAPTPAVPENVSALWVAEKPAGTPVLDEGFICMGGRAPRCPRPARKAAAGPITMDTLQGNWIGSGGAQVRVVGTSVYLNGLLLAAHKLRLNDDDGSVLGIGTLWQLNGWTSSGGVDFRCSSTREGMESARSDVWTRKEVTTLAENSEMERLKLLGYAGSSADPLGRGVEGCMPGTSGAEMPAGAREKQDVELLQALIAQWRESDGQLQPVRSRFVIPDATNRAQTGLGVELVHFIASSMRKKGFKKRKGADGHDIPVLVREPAGSAFHGEALGLWKERAAEEEGFPPVRLTAEDEIFTSLGNGHFFQALNLFDTGCKGINDGGEAYHVGQDALLKEALEVGVPSIVLKHETPRPVRAKIADLLNGRRDYHWTLSDDGTIDVKQMSETTAYCSQFEWLSKGMDAVQVNCLVRSHLGIRVSKRIEG